MTARIFVYCDHPSHAPREVAITNFVALPDGGWHEVPASRASAAGNVATGRHLVGNSTTEAGWALDADVANADIRTNHDLTCRKCPTRPFWVTAEKLYPVLDRWRDSGVPQLSLVAIAASLKKQSEGPEPGQG